MTDRDAFIQAIIELPDDDTLRLVFADWLDEHGEAERAELIRLQCSLNSLPPGSPELAAVQERVLLLLHAHLDDFLTPMTQLGLRFGMTVSPNETIYQLKAVFHRGFVEEITLPGRENLRTFAKHAQALFRLTPLRHIEVTDVRGASEAYDQGYPIGHYDPLIDVLGEEDLRVLVQLPEIARLRTLLLRLDIGTEEARSLATSPFLTPRTMLLLYPATYGTWAREQREQRPSTEIERILRDRFGDCVRWCS